MGDNEGAKLQGNDKLFGILAYIFILWIIGLVVAPEKDHAFVKNHVNNGILLTIASVIVTILSKIPLYWMDHRTDFRYWPFCTVASCNYRRHPGKQVQIPVHR